MEDIRISGGRKAIPLTEFQERVHDWAVDNYDLRADSDQMLFHDEADIETFGVRGTNGEVTGEALFNAGVTDRLTLTDHTKTQICNRFALPKRFMFDDKFFPPELRKDCFEYKFRSMPQDNQLVRARMIGDQAICRGLLTKHYRPYDNVEFVDAIVEAVSVKGVDPGTVKVGSWHIASDMRGIGILPNLRFDQWGNGGPETSDGGGSGGLHPGFKFSNSEIGRSKTRIAGGGWRSYCENGVIYGWNSKAEFAIIHRGQKVMGLMVNEAIADALLLSEEGAKMYMEKMAAQVERTDIGLIVDEWASKYGIAVESTDAWKSMVEADAMRGPVTEFDVINDLTYIARDTENDEEQELLQIVAGDLAMAESIVPARLRVTR